jgi:NADPH:quinone reductase-like Zn-dependent oxidoreductase
VQTMKAMRIYAYGGPEVLTYEDVPRPEPGADDVLIRVHAASVNRVDVAIRAGYMAAWFNYTLPVILGCDVSGTVEAVGSNVTSVAVGTPVYARTALDRDGTYAEYVAMPAAVVAHKPQSLDHIHAAAVPHAALTAWQSLFDMANLASGQAVLIHGTAGGVGHFAVQLAKWRGAQVIGTASGDNLDFLRQLGADQVIDYTATQFEQAAQGVDVVLDTIGGDTQQRSWGTLKRGGMLVSLVQPPSEELANAHGVQHRMMGAQANAGQLAEIAGLIDTGQIKPFVSTILSLQEVAQAHTLIAGGHTRGKIVLQAD